MIIELNSDVNMTTNKITRQIRKQDDQYDNVLQNKSSQQEKDIIKIESNPSYGRVQGYNTAVTEQDYDVTIQTNPSYNSVFKTTEKMSEDEDQHGYVETNLHSKHGAGYLKVIGPTTKEEELVYDVATDDIDKVKINPNPSYDSVSRGIKLENNPSYNK